MRGLGVAMGNAETEVKRNADFVTLGNDEDGIAYVVRKFILGHNTLRLAMHRSYWRLKWRAHKAEKQLSAWTEGTERPLPLTTADNHQV